MSVAAQNMATNRAMSSNEASASNPFGYTPSPGYLEKIAKQKEATARKSMSRPVTAVLEEDEENY